ncbi:histidine phosphatase family protein [Demequina muriae]|uniref:Histidine phosphatase family protein n=1 Tax=Demequina muriae TaxID=3051664 RepID=A0ABT8GIU1_9MICO|nr:histidine phosphatase family protein [Demequina sp. EGI L300058]MDN4481353.1 histidine phosphatase family protein [Demequina sp. EGI L300058]
MDVFVVRHGQTEWNVKGLLQGSSDVELTDAGHAQAAATAQALAGLLGSETTIVTSPLVRARDTADAIAGAIGAAVEVDARLRERAYGAWEGITPEERESGWPEEVLAWRKYGSADVPGFEHHDTVRARMVEALEEWAERAPATLLVVSHGSSARVGMQGLIGLSLDHRTLGNLGNAAWSRLTRRDRGDWTLERHNVTPETLGERS